MPALTPGPSPDGRGEHLIPTHPPFSRRTQIHRAAAVASLSLLVLALGAWACAQGKGGEPPLNPIMGEFAGTFTPAGGQAVKAEAKVIADQNHTVPRGRPLSGRRRQGHPLELPGRRQGR